MSMKSSAGKVGEFLSRPFHSDGAPTRLHPASLTREAAKVASIYLAPVWSKAAGMARTLRGARAGHHQHPGLCGAAARLCCCGSWGPALAGRRPRWRPCWPLVLLLIAIAFVLGKSMYAVKLDLARTRVAVGDNAVGSIAVENTSPRTVLPAALELPVGQATALFHLPRMKPGQVHEDLFTIPTTRRAVITVGPVRSVRADPLQLLRRQVLWTEPTDLFVHPRTTSLDGPAAGFLKDLEGLTTKDLSNSDIAFHALRDYVPGDDRRHIHWKTTARTGKLMVRQFEETRRSHMAVALSVNTDEYEHDDDFELAISAAASLGRQAIKENRELSVITQRGPIRCETGKNLLDDMTRLAGPHPPRHLRGPGPDPLRRRAQRLRGVLCGGLQGDAGAIAQRRRLRAAGRACLRRALLHGGTIRPRQHCRSHSPDPGRSGRSGHGSCERLSRERPQECGSISRRSTNRSRPRTPCRPRPSTREASPPLPAGGCGGTLRSTAPCWRSCWAWPCWASAPPLATTPRYLVAGFGAIVLGLAVAALGAHWRLGLVTMVGLAFAVYMLFGSALAAPGEAILGFIPSLESLRGLLLGIMLSWKQLLTLAPPVGTSVEVMVVPYLSAFVAAVVAGTLAWRLRSAYWAMMPGGGPVHHGHPLRHGRGVPARAARFAAEHRRHRLAGLPA